ncbi:hypothetical protein [Streptomyces sp. ODS28]|uniref:hypothetical protein n=1 Tax=Streptomyces sp. ODS28 TaxID=3136688 RepID=UPI0031EA2B62
MSRAVKTMAVCTVLALVAATGYTVSVGGNGWMWFAWVVLGLATAAAAATGGERER